MGSEGPRKRWDKFRSSCELNGTAGEKGSGSKKQKSPTTGRRTNAKSWREKKKTKEKPRWGGRKRSKSSTGRTDSKREFKKKPKKGEKRHPPSQASREKTKKEDNELRENLNTIRK